MSLKPEISLSKPEEKELISLPELLGPQLPPAVAERRATKAAFADGDLMTPEKYKQHFNSPLAEQTYREMVADTERVNRQVARVGTMQEYINTIGIDNIKTEEDYKFLYDISQYEDIDPETILEERFASKVVEAAIAKDLLESSEGGAVAQAMTTNMEGLNREMDVTQELLTKQELVKKHLEDHAAEVDAMSWGSYLWDLGENILPGAAQLWGPLATELDTESWLVGNKLEELAQDLYRLPTQEFSAELDDILSRVGARNSFAKAQLLQALLDYSSTDQFVDNLFGVFDVVDAATLGASAASRVARVAGVTGKTSKTAGIMKDLAKVNANGKAAASDYLAVAGDIEAAADARVAEVIQEFVKNPGNPLTTVAKIKKTQPGILNPTKMASSPGTLSNAQTRQLLETLGDVDQTLFKIFVDTLSTPRVSGEAVKAMMADARKTWVRTYTHLESNIVDVLPIRNSENIAYGTDVIGIDLGLKNGEYFKTAEAAAAYNTRWLKLKPGSFEVTQVANDKFVVRTFQNIDETSMETRLARVATDNATPSSWASTWLGYIRSPAYTLSDEHMKARITATLGMSEVQKLLAKAAAPISKKLSKKQKSRLSDMLDSNRYMKEEVVVNPLTGETKSFDGSWYYTPKDFQEAYYSKFREMPSMDEMEGYFTYKTIHDWDFFARNMAEYRDMARQGYHQVELTFPQKHPYSGGKKFKGKRPDSAGPEYIMAEQQAFDGKVVDSLPPRNQEYTVAWFKENGGPQLTLSTNSFSKNSLDNVEALLATGKYKIVKVANPYDETVRGMVGKGDLVNYIVAPNVNTKPLSVERVPYRGGPHAMYNEARYFIKQPSSWKSSLGRRILGADRTWVGATTQAEADARLAAMEKGRMLIKNGATDTELDAFVQGNLPYRDGKAFRKLFRRSDGKEMAEGFFDIDTPFYRVGSGQRVIDRVGRDALASLWGDARFVDSVTDGGLVGSVNRYMTQHRDDALLRVDTVGTTENPVLSLRPFPTIDPMETLARAGSQIVRDRYFDDIKHRAVEDWLTEFGDVLKIDAADANANPLDALKNPRWLDGADTGKLMRAKTSRRSILSFIGQESELSKKFAMVREAILNQAFKVGGTKATDFVELALWNENTNPIGMMRGWVFNAKLGMFNPRQLFMQAQGAVIVAGIDGNPARAIQANLAVSAQQALYYGKSNKAFAKHVATGAKALGISSDEFMEMYSAMEKSGIMNVGREVAMLDQLSTGIFDGKLTKFLDRSNGFFNFGERHVRMVAFNTAYLKWRAENKTAKLTNNVIRDLTQRSHLLFADMTRAANNPALSQGPLSMFTQFWTFHTRMTEAMLGTRLTKVERGRLMAVMTAIYGVPSGIGITAGSLGVNIYDYLRQAAIEQGVDVNDPWAEMFFNGIGGLMASVVAGEQVNYGNSLGPSGLTWFEDLFWDGELITLGGASAKFIRDVSGHLEPFMSSVWAALDGDADGIGFGQGMNMALSDFSDAMREISSINAGARAYAAITTGQLMTQGRLPVADISERAAIFQAITGMVPTYVDDTWATKEMLSDAKKYKQDILLAASKYGRRMMEAAVAGNVEEARTWQMRMYIAIESANLSLLERGEYQLKFYTDNKNLYQKVNKDLWSFNKDKIESWETYGNSIERERERKERK